MTLREAAVSALEKNPSVEAAAHEEKAAEAGVKQAKSAFYPRVDFKETFTNGNNPVYTFGTLLGQRRFTGADFDLDRLNHPDPVNNFKSEVTVWQSIYEGGGTRARKRAAELNVGVKEKQSRRVVQGILFDVVRHYQGIQLAKEGVEASRGALRSAESSRDRARNMVDAGMVVKSDLLRLEVFVADLRRKLLEAENECLMARAALDVDMGGEAEGSVDPPSPLKMVGYEAEQEAVYRESALRDRPDLLQLSAAVEMARQRVVEAKAEAKFTVGAFTTLEYDQGTGADRSGANYMLGVQAKYNIFDGKYKGAKAAEAESNLAALEAQLRHAKNQVSLHVKDAWLRLRTARELHKVALEAVGQAEESLRIVRDRYESGLAILTDLTQAETALLGARTNLSSAVYGFNVAVAGLELAAGRLGLDSQVFKE